MDALVPILFVGGFVALFAWLIWRGIQIDRRRKAELAALAQERGWQVDDRKDGRQRVIELVPTDRAWRLTLAHPYKRSSGKNATTNPGWSEFRSTVPDWPGGRAIFTQKLPGGLERVVGSGSGLTGMMQNFAVKTLLNRVIPREMLADLDRLTPFDPPPGVELAILATEDPRGGDLAAVHEAIHGWRPKLNRDRSPPAVTIGPEGTGVRLPMCLVEAEDIAQFVDHALALAERLAASGGGPRPEGTSRRATTPSAGAGA